MILMLLSCTNQSDRDPASWMRLQLEKAKGCALVRGVRASNYCMYAHGAISTPGHLCIILTGAVTNVCKHAWQKRAALCYRDIHA